MVLESTLQLCKIVPYEDGSFFFPVSSSVGVAALENKCSDYLLNSDVGENKRFRIRGGGVTHLQDEADSHWSYKTRGGSEVLRLSDGG